MSVTIVIPLYNEQESIRELLESIDQVLTQLNKPFDVIVVNDGSSDGSTQALELLEQEKPFLKVIHFTQNQGKAAALMAGFKLAQGDVVVTMDADLQDNPQSLPEMIAAIEDKDFDMVSGYKFDRKDPFIKVVTSKLFNFVVRKFSKIELNDFNCGFKAYKNKVVKDINIYGELHRFIPVLVKQKYQKIGEVRVIHQARKYGCTKYGPGRFWRGFLDFLTVVLITRYAQKPMHFFGGIGVIISGLGFILLALLSCYRLIYGTFGGRNPLLLLGILLMIVGMQFLCTGLLGEMFIYSHENRRTND